MFPASHSKLLALAYDFTMVVMQEVPDPLDYKPETNTLNPTPMPQPVATLEVRMTWFVYVKGMHTHAIAYSRTYC